MAFRFRHARLFVVAALSAFVLFATASSALAAPAAPTLGLTALQDRLDASETGTLQGYLKTVVRGSLIETIPVEVVGMTGDTPSSSLILFRAYGPKIDAYGGIASGMSGSPIYIEDEGVDKVIGALSYGDSFSLDGAGLATPIEAMLQLIADYSPRTRTLSDPVMLSGRLIDRVIVSAHPENLAAASASGAFVARPLASVYIGGLRPGSAAYEHISGLLAKENVSVVGRDTPLSAGASSFSTDLVPGAAIGSLASRGDMWIGGLGTVTYTDGDSVLAYGHPAYWTGPSSMYMTNAWITGVWGSQDTPYKIGYPTAVQGEITQDRNAGIMGTVGEPPAELPITAHAELVDTGADADSHVWMSSKLVDSGMLSDAAGSAASVAAYRLFDTWDIPGSANTTATIVVNDGESDHTVTIANMFDDDMDVAYRMTADIDEAMYNLIGVLGDGIEHPHIVSVDLQSEVTATRRNARIVGVDALAPLHPGRNAVRVSLLAYGVSATQTVDTTLTIPEDAPLTGTITAASANGYWGDDEYYYYGESTTEPRRTIAQVVEDLNETPSNNELTVTFQASDDESDLPPELTDSESEPIEASATTPWVVNGSASTEVTVIDAIAEPVTYGYTAYIYGMITGPTEPVEVSVYSIDYDGGRGELLASGEAELMDGELAFAVPLEGVTRTSEFLVAVDGGQGYTPAETYVVVPVRGRVRLGVTPKTMWRGSWVIMSAAVTPRWATGSVAFQYYDAHAKHWRTLTTKRLSRTSSVARAGCTWRPTRGTWKIRAIYRGGGGFMGAVSSTVTLKVR